jgi:flagellar hook-associated protein 2
VVTDSNGARLSIVSNSSGTASDVKISGATGLNFTRAATGADASLTVDGIPIVSASNTVTGVVAGLTFNLVSAAPGTPVNIATSLDVDKSSQAVTDFVNAYNQVIQDVTHEFTVAANGVGGPLAGDSTLRMLQDMMLGSASFSNSGTFPTLASLGITMNDDGTLTVDSGALEGALTSNFTAVQSFFQGTGSNGFASTLDAQLDLITSPTDGAFTVELKSIGESTKDLQDHIDNFQVFLKSEQARLTDQYNKVAALLQQLPILEKQIEAQLGNISNGS